MPHQVRCPGGRLEGRLGHLALQEKHQGLHQRWVVLLECLEWSPGPLEGHQGHQGILVLHQALCLRVKLEGRLGHLELQEKHQGLCQQWVVPLECLEWSLGPLEGHQGRLGTLVLHQVRCLRVKLEGHLGHLELQEKHQGLCQQWVVLLECLEWSLGPLEGHQGRLGTLVLHQVRCLRVKLEGHLGHLELQEKHQGLCQQWVVPLECLEWCLGQLEGLLGRLGILVLRLQ